MNMTQKKTSRLRTAIAALAAAGLIATQMPHAAAESIHDNPLYTGMGILVDRGQEPSAAVHAAPLALVKTAGKWGAVSTTGTAVIAAEYDEIRPYAEGYLLVRQGKKWGVFRADGKQVVPAAYRHIEELTEDRIVVQDMDKKWGGYGTDGTLILPVTQRDVVPYHDGAALVQGADKRWSFYRADGSRLTEKTYAYVGIFSEGLASIMEDKKHVGFIDKTGAEVIAPQYASASIFSEGLAAVEVGGKWGFIDRTGTMVIAPQYREIPMGFSEGLAAVRGKKGLAYIDKTGTQVFAAPYDYALPFHDGLAEVRRKVKSTNFLGAVLTIAAGTAGQFIYDPLMLDDENVKRGYIDKTGTMIISIKNDYNSTFVDGTALVKVKSRWGCVDRTGAYLV
ncbi:MAG: WG repeat-containing protein, partial [Selenomonas sp.]|nr:WG repeat-containing protein [Selenomonas sp.]